MIGTHYKAHKDNVIDLYKGYKEKRGDINDGIDIDFLGSRIKSLEVGKYTLAVAGEVKAGKSTFINALLGAEILPSDVLQASSAIVEIFKSEKSYLKVRYADGREEEIYDDLTTPDIDEAKERLHEICSISDTYRSIPTTLIDEYIVKSSGNLKVTPELISRWEGQSGDNNLADKKSLIQEYILNRPRKKIPIEIDFGYPLKWDFDELRIVDSPGVNAVGGVQDVSFQFFEEANSILFVHSIKPVESESFRKFVDSVISNRSKETLFLVLTHAGLYSEEEVNKLHSEAIRLYSDIIPKERIVFVDSLLKLIHCDLKNGKPLKEIRSADDKKKILASYREKAEDEERELVDVVYEGSHFEEMLCSIDKFSMDAPNLQLQEILEHIRNGYKEQELLFEEKSERLEMKKQNPQAFEREIDRIRHDLDEYTLLLNKTKEDVISDYSGKHSSWQKDINELKLQYPELITGANSIETTRKHTADGMNEVGDRVNAFSEELTKDLSLRLAKVNKEFQKQHKISLPKVDLKSLEEKTKNQAFITKTIYETESVWDNSNWLMFKWAESSRRYPVGLKKIYDNNKHLSSFKIQCNENFYTIVNDIPNKSTEVLHKYLDLFSSEMKLVIQERQVALEKEQNKKQKNLEIISELNELKIKKNSIQPEVKRIEELLEDIR